MKRRSLIIILCIAAVCILSACNKTEGPVPEKPEAAYGACQCGHHAIL